MFGITVLNHGLSSLKNEGGWWSAMCYLMAEDIDMLEKFFGGTWGMRCEGDVTCLSELDCADFNTDAA